MSVLKLKLMAVLIFSGSLVTAAGSLSQNPKAIDLHQMRIILDNKAEAMKTLDIVQDALIAREIQRLKMDLSEPAPSAPVQIERAVRES